MPHRVVGHLLLVLLATLLGCQPVHRGKPAEAEAELLEPDDVVSVPREEGRPWVSWERRHRAAPPIQLTTSDGGHLELRRLRAHVFYADPLAVTELHLTFASPEGRDLEGRFQVELPQGASIARFATKLGAVWIESEIADRRDQDDRLAAARVLAEPLDPRQFSASVGPIRAGVGQEIIVSYSQRLGAGVYSLPLAGVGELERFAIRVELSDHRSDPPIELRKSDRRLAADFELRPLIANATVAARGGESALIRYHPVFEFKSDPLDDVLVLVDQGQSSAREFATTLSRLAQVLKRFPPSSNTPRIAPLGEALHELGLADRVPRRIVVVSDGDLESGMEEVLTQLEFLEHRGLERVDVLSAGRKPNLRTLGAIARQLHTSGTVTELSPSHRDTRRRLEQACLGSVRVLIPGATRVWPPDLRGVQSGDEVLIYVTFPPTHRGPLRVGFGDDILDDMVIEPTKIDAMLVDREVVGSRVRALADRTAREPDHILYNYWRHRMLRLSQDFHIRTDDNVLVASENPGGYPRFGIHHSPHNPMMAIEDGYLWVSDHPSRPSNRAWEFDAAPPPDWLESQAFVGGVISHGSVWVTSDPSSIFATANPSPGLDPVQ